MKEKVTVTIRSVSERTEALCKKLIVEQGIPENQIFLVKEVPFSKSLLKSLQIGLHENTKYMLCIDADVLLRPNSIKTLVDVFEVLPPNICEIQGYVYDKFFGGARAGGIHLYRNSLLPKIIALIENNPETIRPETYALNQMKAAGYPWFNIDYAIGLHDDEQYYEDIYRKCFVHGIKHLTMAQNFITIWKNNLAHDTDFAVALQAFSDSITYEGEVEINKNHQFIAQSFKKLGVTEKGSLNMESINLDTIEERLISFKEDAFFISKNPYFKNFYSKRPNLGQLQKKYGRNRKVFKPILIPVANVFKWIGNLCLKIGNRLQYYFNS